MYTNSGYLNNSLIDFMDKSKPLIVGSCGTYRLITKEKLPTYRPKGRLDYQLIYIAAGKGHFFINGKEEIVPAGHMVLYRPKEVQKYNYYGADKTEVYWVHFTGSNIKNILKEYHLPSSGNIIYTGNSSVFHEIFRKMISELQMCKPHFEEYLSMLLKEIFLHISRQTFENKKCNTFVHAEMEESTKYFNNHYNTDINIENYAASKHMSTCWFIRNFKDYNGISPMRYILNLRIANAKNLLHTTSYTIAEIADIVGYDNALYFSKLFKKYTGLSPSEYRKQQTV